MLLDGSGKKTYFDLRRHCAINGDKSRLLSKAGKHEIFVTVLLP